MIVSVETRTTNLARLRGDFFDILVLGGGITGAGIAHYAARCGHKVALVEKGDCASGTSSKSSRLVHGGLRYLEHGAFRLVREACLERYDLLHLAPHLVWPLPFVLPVYKQSQVSMSKIRAGMWLYDGLAGFRGIQHHQIWSSSVAASRLPLLHAPSLRGAACYYDCATDDARLTLANLLAAHRNGAVVATYTEVHELLYTCGRIKGVHVSDRLGGESFDIRARVVISAAGPWTDQIPGLPARSGGKPWLRLTKGVHLIVPHHCLPLSSAVAFHTPQDNRIMFAIPWQSYIILGTTDTDYDDEPERVCATHDDVSYLLEATHHAFPQANIHDQHVLSAYAGLRPLIRQEGASVTQTSREHRLTEVRPGLLAIAGGKLTTYRVMARQAVEHANRILTREYQLPFRCHPRRMKYEALGTVRYRKEDYDPYWEAMLCQASVPDDVAAHLVATYGPQVQPVMQMIRQHPRLATRLVADRPVILAQVVYAVRHEMAFTLEDVLARRTHVSGLARDQGLGCVALVAQTMADELGWSDAQRNEQVARYLALVEHHRQWRHY